jgi:drug/metabolite transporter (DMT)-like permease
MTKVQMRPMLALLALSVLAALGSLRGDLWPGHFRAAEALPALERQALAWAELAVCARLLALARRQRLSRAAWRQSALAGLGLFAAPALLVQLSAPYIPQLTRVALFGLVPVLAVVLEPYLGESDSGRGALGPALVALAGMLCVFSVDLPGSVIGALALAAMLLAVACVAAANCRAVWAAGVHGGATAARAAVAALTASIALGIFCLFDTRIAPPSLALLPTALWVLAIDLPTLLMLFWLMRHITAARMTLRFVLAPLIASLAGVALFAPTVSVRAWLGLMLMAAGSAWMLLQHDTAEGSSTLSLR